MLKKIIWFSWILITLAVLGFYGYQLFVDANKEELLIGDTSHGHFQIELACSTCHTEPFGGKELIQDACVSCHQDELKAASDSHPMKKFTNPRNADLLEIIDARSCISCHTEHQEEQTRPMGLTMPEDYCFHCHKDVGKERPSHENLGFETCASAGCHNYHDNKALYESFLVNNAGGHWVKAMDEIVANTSARKVKKRVMQSPPPEPDTAKLFAEMAKRHPDISQHTAATSHAKVGVNCGGCHLPSQQTQEKKEWIPKPAVEQCQSCHQPQAESFKKGKHGMRLVQNMPAIKPSESKLSFKHSALDVQQGCNSCHAPHKFETQFAATEACLTCHNDEHSTSFEASPHGQLALKAALEGGSLDKTVTCATCHMPKVSQGKSGTNVVNNSNKDDWVTQHNQNNNLRPNEKMIRSVCMDCHSLEFSIDALADEELIKNNFNGKPKKHLPSIDWALEREKK